MTLFAEIFGLALLEIAVIGVLALLLFGRKLPDVGRYLGKSIAEFRKDKGDAGEGRGRGNKDDDEDEPDGVLARLKPKPPTLPGRARRPR